MSDLNEIKKQQEKAQEIITQQIVMPIDMQTVKDKSAYNNDVYNVATKEKENEFINKLFAATKVKNGLSADDRAKLRNVEERNMSHLLLNDHRLFKDSSYMEDVKGAVTDLENLLQSKSIETATLGEVAQKFETAISACNEYLSNKNPWFSSGKRRKRKVTERLERLKQEKDLFYAGRLALECNLLKKQPQTPMDLIIEGRKQDENMSNDMSKVRVHYKIVNDIKGKDDNPTERVGFFDHALHAEYKATIKQQENEDKYRVTYSVDIKDGQGMIYNKYLKEAYDKIHHLKDIADKNPAAKELCDALGEMYTKDCQKRDLWEFLSNVKEKHPDSKIDAIGNIWGERDSYMRERTDLIETLDSIADSLENNTSVYTNRYPIALEKLIEKYNSTK